MKNIDFLELDNVQYVRYTATTSGFLIKSKKNFILWIALNINTIVCRTIKWLNT